MVHEPAESFTLTRTEMSHLISKAVAEGVKMALSSFVAQSHVCRLPLDDDVVKKVPLLTGMVEALGDQEGRDPARRFERGVEAMAVTVHWVQERREVCEPDCSLNHQLVSAVREREGRGKLSLLQALDLLDTLANNTSWFKRIVGKTVLTAIILGLLALLALGLKARVAN